MRRLALALILVLSMPVLLWGAEVITLGDGSEPISVRVLESTGARTVIDYTIGSFTKSPVKIGSEVYYGVDLGKESKTQELGLPGLPDVRRSIIIPDDARMEVRVLSSHYVDFPATPIAPSKGVLTRKIAPESVPYSFSSFYGTAGWYPEDIARGGEPYIMRDKRGMVVVVSPFSYDPSTQTLRVYDHVTVEVVSAGRGKINVLTARPPDGTPAEFQKMYRRHFLNYQEDRYTPIGEVGNMLVICYDDFMTNVEPFVEWKKQMGVPCEMVSVSVAGGSANAIDSYIEDYYFTNGLTFVVLVGDAEQLPPLFSSGGASDPSLSLIVGSDNYPDIIVGRFSAANLFELNPQIERSIEYEKLPQAGADWYHKGMGVASNQGPGDDGEYDDEHIDNVRGDLLAFSYTEIDQIYDPYGTASMVSTALNDGRSIINYCGHGSTTSWGSTGFSNSHINALVNDNMLPTIVSVACVNGKFNGTTCFAEAWMRATNGPEPTGAVAVYMSSVNQYWNEPMDAQDEVVDLLVAEEKRTFGALCFNGSCHMMDEYGSSGADMFRTWIYFGDPSLRVRTDTPGTMTVIHDENIDSMATTFNVTVVGLEEALCSLYHDGTLYGSAFTDAGGSATIDILEALPEEEDLTLTVTAFNKISYFGSVHVGPTFVPIIVATPTYFDVSLSPEEITTETLTISNTGEPGSVLHYSIEIVDPESGDRSLTGSSVSVDPEEYESGATADFVFSVYNGSGDDEWITDVALDFPDGAVVNTCTDFVVGSRVLTWNGASGDGAYVTWTGSGYSNVVYPGESAVATVNLTMDQSLMGPAEIAFEMTGDGWGSAPHTVVGTVVISAPPGPSVTLIAPNGGEVWGIDEEHEITWTSEGEVEGIQLRCSSDGGATWLDIVSGTPNDGSHTWAVCGEKSTQCLVEISAFSMMPVVDTSDGPFTIFQPIYWLTADPTSGSVPQGESQDVVLEFDASGRAPGDYYADIIISSNGGDPVVIPVVLHITGTGVEEELPAMVVLRGNYPNPFNPITTIAFALPTPEDVRLTVYSVDGRLVKELANDEFGAGAQAVVWDGRNEDGVTLPSGVYFYRLEAVGKVLEKKMIMMK